MSTAVSIVLSFILMANPCLSSISELHAMPNISSPSSDISTIEPILSTMETTHSYRSVCNNFTSCSDCMHAKDSHNLQCSWIQHAHNSNITFNCIESSQCSYDEIECCASLVCCNCLSQTNCIECGSQGLNVSCLWDHTNAKCLTPNHTCSAHEQCLNNPSLLRCEYARNGACSFYFTTTSFWTMGYAGMLIFFICLPCCLYHKCGIDWDSEFSLMSIYNQNMSHNNNVNINDDYDQLQPPNDGYIFKGGAHITGRCMYGSFLLFGFLFACVAVFGTVLSISCLDENY